MGKFENISEFESLLKSELNGHSTPPPSDVWTNVASSTQSAGGLTQAFNFFKSATNLLKVGLFAGGVAAIGITIYNENKLEVEVPDTANVVLVDTSENVEVITDLEKLNDGQEVAEKISINKNKRPDNAKDQRISEKDLVLDDSNNPPVQKDASQATIASEDNSAENSKDETTPKVKSGDITITISNENPCLGETISLKSTKGGDWYMDGKLFYKNKEQITYLCNKTGTHSIVLSLGNESYERNFKVSDNSFTLLKTKKGNGEYICSIDPQSVKAVWTLDNKVIAQNQNQILVKLDEVGSQNLVAKAIDLKCADDKSITLSRESEGKLKTYNTFTPDGDGHNDEYPIDISGYDYFFLQIFDRSGKLVYSSESPENKWNGRIFNNGNESDPGEYIARIKYRFIGEQIETKNVRLTLIRP